MTRVLMPRWAIHIAAMRLRRVTYVLRIIHIVLLRNSPRWPLCELTVSEALSARARSGLTYCAYYQDIDRRLSMNLRVHHGNCHVLDYS